MCYHRLVVADRLFQVKKLLVVLDGLIGVYRLLDLVGVLLVKLRHIHERMLRNLFKSLADLQNLRYLQQGGLVLRLEQAICLNYIQFGCLVRRLVINFLCDLRHPQGLVVVTRRQVVLNVLRRVDLKDRCLSALERLDDVGIMQALSFKQEFVKLLDVVWTLIVTNNLACAHEDNPAPARNDHPVFDLQVRGSGHRTT